MATERPSRRQHSSGASPLPPSWALDMTERFRQSLSTNRMNTLSSSSSRSSSFRSRQGENYDIDAARPTPRRRAHPPTRHGSGRRPAHGSPPDEQDDFSLGNPPSRPCIKNLPLIPTAPQDTRSRQFRNQLHMLSETPCKWENPGLLDEAMTQVPLDRIYQEADEESQLFQATAESMGKKPAWAWQDCVIRALVKWFRKSFFTWVNNPPCSACGAPTIAKGMCAPIPDERARGASRVELYQCSMEQCASYERFPRYSDAFVLMQTQRGRCGEWANCFSMLCRAMGSRVRWVWNSEDRVWTEVYSDYRKRWLHVDACEGAFDKPLLYTEGWGNKIGYCVAFSADGCADVTRRYCRDPLNKGAERSKASEAELLFILQEIRHLRRKDMAKAEKFRLEGEEQRESRELRHYYISHLISEVSKLIAPVPNSRKTAAQLADEQKARERAEEAQARQSHNAEWGRGLGEDGRHDRRPQ